MEKKQESSKKQLEKKLTKSEKKLLKKTIRDSLKAKAGRVHKESKKILLTAIVAAFSFLMALSWREVIIEYIDLLESLSPIQGKLIEALLVTIIAIIGILLAKKILSEE
jgi:hypothetical protein